MPFMLWISRRLNPGRRRYEMLAERITALESLVKQAADKPNSQPLIIQHADKVVLEKVDFSNHFGTMEIQSLEGRLNIGLNYIGPLHPDTIPPLLKPPQPPQMPINPNSSDKNTLNNNAPKCNIRPRTPSVKNANENPHSGTHE